MEKILVLNSGSTTVKFQLFEMEQGFHRVLAKGMVDRIGLPGSKIVVRADNGYEFSCECSVTDHKDAIKAILDYLSHRFLKNAAELSAVGHRMGHGGEYFDRSVIIDDDVMAKIYDTLPLLPLHGPAFVHGVEAMTELLPGVLQVATFDSAFHQSVEKPAFTYAIPREYYEKERIRRYGFHGTSHKFVAQKGCELAGLDFAKAKVVTCHIGNGASVAAVDGGRSIDTSMGFTPVDGLLMGTRCGEVDPGALTYIADKEHMTGNEVWGMINKQAGVLGITGLSSDMRDIENAAAEGNERAKLALDVYYYRVKKYVGAYAAAMGGLDLVVFTGGVGENDPALREYVCSGMEFLGLEFDADVNRGLRGKDTILTKPASRVKAALIATNEELVIATDTFDIVEKLR